MKKRRAAIEKARDEIYTNATPKFNPTWEKEYPEYYADWMSAYGSEINACTNALTEIDAGMSRLKEKLCPDCQKLLDTETKD